jgi:predicted phosphodiesterase
MKNIIFIALITILISCSKTEESKDFSVGIIADCQYCDCDIKWNRYYKKAPQRLRKAVSELNNQELAYTIHLGDFIDQHFSSFDSLVPTWNQLKSPSYHVLGNHDFEVKDSLKSKIFEKLNLKKRYYSIDQNDWKFIVLDGTDLSFYGALDSVKQNETKELFSKKERDSLPYAKVYNGGLSKEQFTWVEQELVNAKDNNQNVGFYCHFPLLPIDNGNLWNTEELQKLIEKNKHVKFFMNGHKHAGAYNFKKGVHYLTFKGMVNTSDSTSFATAHFYKDSIQIKGYGREVDRILKITR